MAYKKGDILIFMTNDPIVHLCKMCNSPVDSKKVEKDEYYGFVKSVISAKEGLYLMRTIKPIEGFSCITKTEDIIRQVDKDELPENEREYKSCEAYEAPNIYIPPYNVEYEKLTDEQRCIALTKDAVSALFPEITITSLKFDNYWFSKKERIDSLDWFDNDVKQIKNPAKKKELLKLKDEIIAHMQTLRFKEYYAVNVGMPCKDAESDGFEFITDVGDTIKLGGTYYMEVAVSKEFDEVCIMRDLDERSNFARSLGPEYNDLEDAFSYYREKIWEDKK